MPTLLIPLGLAALAALVLPALIHLARRSEARQTDFAALRWLRQKPKPRQRLRFDEWPLLLVRLLLLTLIALWLARPAWQGDDATTPWLVAVPGVDAAQARASTTEDIEARWLAPGFPPLTDTPPTGGTAVASLLRQLDAELPAGARLTVLAPERLSGLDGERLRLSRAVTWRVLPGTVPALRSTPPATPKLAVRYAPERADSLRYLRAAAAAWQIPGRPLAYEAAPAGASLPDPSSILVWLAPGPLPASVADWIGRGGIALIDEGTTVEATGPRLTAWRDARGAALVEEQPLGRGRILRLRRPLAPAAMPQLLEPDFPRRLRELLALPAPPSSAWAADMAPSTGGATYRPPVRDLRSWLAIFIALLFLSERWMATRQARRVAP